MSLPRTALRPLRRLRPPPRTPRTTTARFSSSPAPAMAANKSDWSADQYLKFDDERTRAVHDLVHRVPLPGGRFPRPADARPLRIVDLGCGPGNSTAVLAARFPDAALAGVDRSPNMLARARATLPGVPFARADLAAWAPAPADPPADLLLANAVLHWLPLATRLPTVLRLLATQPAGGVFAYQVPDNRAQPSHAAMRAVARGEAPAAGAGPDAPWVPLLRGLHDRDDIEPPAAIYDALAPHCASVDIWHAVYHHVLPGGVHDIVEWLRGTGLQPFLNALPDENDDDDADADAAATGLRAAFLAAYERHLAAFYPPRVDGSVLLAFPRLFVVAVKK